MKLHKILFLLCLAGSVSTMSFRPADKYFEGEIEYKVTAQSFIKELNAKDIIKQLGDKSFFWFKNGDYRQETDGTFAGIEYFDHSTVKYYSLKPGSDTFSMQDASIKTDTVIRTDITKLVKKVAGYMCDKYVIQTVSYPGKTSTTMRFYYSEAAAGIDPAWYARAERHSQRLIRQNIKSVPLEIEIEGSSFKITISATKITRKPLTDEEVHLPKDAKVKAVD